MITLLDCVHCTKTPNTEYRIRRVNVLAVTLLHALFRGENLALTKRTTVYSFSIRQKNDAFGFGTQKQIRTIRSTYGE